VQIYIYIFWSNFQGAADGAGDLALTKKEVITYFTNRWGSFLVPETLAPLAGPPAPRPSPHFFTPTKHYVIAGCPPSLLQHTKVADAGGLESWVSSVVDRRCEVVNEQYLRWKEHQWNLPPHWSWKMTWRHPIESDPPFQGAESQVLDNAHDDNTHIHDTRYTIHDTLTLTHTDSQPPSCSSVSFDILCPLLFF
jgi:hypothetical protein